MFINKSANGKNNICGQNIKKLRKNLPSKPSQREFAEMLQIEGLDIDKNSVQRIEAGLRFVPDIELKIIAHVLNVTVDDLLKEDY